MPNYYFAKPEQFSIFVITFHDEAHLKYIFIINTFYNADFKSIPMYSALLHSVLAEM